MERIDAVLILMFAALGVVTLKPAWKHLWRK